TLQAGNIVARAISEGRTLIMKDQLQDATPSDRSLIESVVEIAVPLKVEDQILGALYIRSPEGSPFTPDHLQLAEMLAAQLALAIFESHSIAQRQEENWITTILLEVAQHASRPGDVNQALQSVLQLTTLVAGTSWAILLLNEESGHGLRVGPVAGLRRMQQLGIREFNIHPSSINLTPPYKESDRPILIKLPEYIANAMKTEHANALVLSDGASLLGVLLLEDIELSERRNSLLAGIAQQISLRIENARLVDEIAARRSLQHEIAMARNIQQSFLPKFVPIYPGWELGVTWQMARDVGGDFYDFIPLPAGPDGPRLGIVIADVAGKGVPAALLMAMCRTLLRSVAIRRIEPGITLERLNEILFQDTETDLFISLFYALWEPEANKLSYANAGHNPPLLFTPEQPAQIVGDHGIVLHVDEKATYETYQLHCSPESMLVMYTDGVTEAMTSAGELFDLHRLEHLVLGMKDWKAQSVADRIAERVRLFTAEPDLSDDLTAIVLRRTGEAES
ncbi:MAG: SpoIIE family protein phosphatase, partial [Anaerolineales bacterium]